MKFFDNKQNIYKLVKVLTPVQILLWLQVFEPFAYSRGEDSPVLMLTLAILSFGLYLMFRIFCKTASKFQKLMLGVFIGLVLVNISLGFFNEYWLRNVAGIDGLKQKQIKSWLSSKKDFPNTIINLYENDSILILGESAKRINDYYWLGGNNLKPELQQKFNLTDIEYLVKKVIPSDFLEYRKMQKVIDDTTKEKVIFDFFGMQFPNYAPFVILKNNSDCCQALFSPFPVTESCYFCLSEDQTRESISPILFEIIDGEFDDRLRKYYHALEEIFWPTYATAEYENDPYFLIYQGRYKEAREGLKDLPPDRRVFCEKKLEKLGY